MVKENDKLLIWGTGSFYNNYIARYFLNGDINVIGFITGINTVCKELDGRPIFTPDSINDIEFDYIVIAIADQATYKDIRKRISSDYKIPAEKCISGKVFKNPCFNWERYIKIIQNPPTIITEACYGGYVYNQLGMQFHSPFINTRIFERDYIKLINNLNYYLQQDVYIAREVQSVVDMNMELSDSIISWGKMGYPIIMLKDIKLHAIHATNSNIYIEEWKRRKERINWNNIWIFMIIENDEMAEKFKEIECKNKVGLYYKETDCEEIVCLREWSDYRIRLRSGHDFLSYVHHLVYDEMFMRYIDIFKLLTGDKDFIRMN